MFQPIRSKIQLEFSYWSKFFNQKMEKE